MAAGPAGAGRAPAPAPTAARTGLPSAAEQAGVRDRFTVVDGARIRFRDRGGDGPVLLLTHGIGQSLEVWHLQFEVAGAGPRLIAWDLPGHGPSVASAAAMGLEGQADVAWKLLDRLGVDEVCLVGHALGAAVSLRMQAQRPQRVRACLLADGAALGPEVFAPFRLMSLPWLGEWLCRPGPGRLACRVRALVRRPQACAPPVCAALERQRRHPGSGAHVLALLRGLVSPSGQRRAVWWRSHEILRALAVPLLIVHGEADAVVPVAQARRVQALVPGAELFVLPDCGHTPQLEQPGLFAELLRRLARLGGGR